MSDAIIQERRQADKIVFGDLHGDIDVALLDRHDFESLDNDDSPIDHSNTLDSTDQPLHVDVGTVAALADHMHHHEESDDYERSPDPVVGCLSLHPCSSRVLMDIDPAGERTRSIDGRYLG